jgi:hypothetical protein
MFQCLPAGRFQTDAPVYPVGDLQRHVLLRGWTAFAYRRVAVPPPLDVAQQTTLKARRRR